VSRNIHSVMHQKDSSLSMPLHLQLRVSQCGLLLVHVDAADL
jgi:hypothetical protein